MKTIQIPVTESKLDQFTFAEGGKHGESKTDHVLVLSRSLKRFGIGGVPAGHVGRQVTQGPLVPGPWAFTFGLASVIAANPEHGTYGEIKRNLAAGREHTVEEGDRIVFDGVTYEVQVTDGFGKRQADGRPYTDYSFIKLVEVAGDEPARCAFCQGDHVIDACPNIDPEQLAAEHAPDSRELAEDYPGQRITGPDYDTRDREGADDDPGDGGEEGVGPMADARRELPHLLAVINARIDGAVDTADWSVIEEQLREAVRLARKATGRTGRARKGSR